MAQDSLLDVWRSFAEEVKAYKKQLTDELERLASENVEMKNMIQMAGRAMNNPRATSYADEQTPREEGGMQYLSTEQQERAWVIRLLLRDIDENSRARQQQVGSKWNATSKDFIAKVMATHRRRTWELGGNDEDVNARSSGYGGCCAEASSAGPPSVLVATLEPAEQVSAPRESTRRATARANPIEIKTGAQSLPQGRWGDFSARVHIYSNQIKAELAELTADNVKTKHIIEEAGRSTGGSYVISFSEEIKELDVPEFKYITYEKQKLAKFLLAQLEEIEHGSLDKMLKDREAWDKAEAPESPSRLEGSNGQENVEGTNNKDDASPSHSDSSSFATDVAEYLISQKDGADFDRAMRAQAIDLTTEGREAREKPEVYNKKTRVDPCRIGAN
jgi:hypothetical protein